LSGAWELQITAAAAVALTTTTTPAAAAAPAIVAQLALSSHSARTE